MASYTKSFTLPFLPGTTYPGIYPIRFNVSRDLLRTKNELLILIAPAPGLTHTPLHKPIRITSSERAKNIVEISVLEITVFPLVGALGMLTLAFISSVGLVNAKNDGNKS